MGGASSTDPAAPPDTYGPRRQVRCLTGGSSSSPFAADRTQDTGTVLVRPSLPFNPLSQFLTDLNLLLNFQTCSWSQKHSQNVLLLGLPGASSSAWSFPAPLPKSQHHTCLKPANPTFTFLKGIASSRKRQDTKLGTGISSSQSSPHHPGVGPQLHCPHR